MFRGNILNACLSFCVCTLGWMYMCMGYACQVHVFKCIAHTYLYRLEIYVNELHAFPFLIDSIYVFTSYDNVFHIGLYNISY